MQKKNNNKLSRRDIIKGLASVPVLGAFGFSLIGHNKLTQKRESKSKYYAKKWGIDQNFNIGKIIDSSVGKTINIGIIGFGYQGGQLAKALGFVEPKWVEKCESSPEGMGVLNDFLSQSDLNVRIAGVCDVFEDRIDCAVKVSENHINTIKYNQKMPSAKIYSHYKEMLADENIDAIIIATPDFWHATMVKDAVAAGKHIYCEKPMTIDVEDAIEVRQKVKESGLIFQLGHQNYQQNSHILANQLYKKGVIGKLNMVEFTANRYRVSKTPFGDKEKLRNRINWDAFQEIIPNKRDFDPHRFFNWYHFLDYGIGVAGTMLTHEYASANQILEMGIPTSVFASGGRYVSKFKGDIPDVYNAAFEYPDKEFSFLYSLTYGNSIPRGRWIMGDEGCMQVGNDVFVYPELNSKKYNSESTTEPIFQYQPGSDVDGVTSASQKYFAKKGLMYTYRNGKRVDTLHLHVKDWIDSIRTNGTPLCNIDLGFEEAVTCVMAHKSYLEKRQIQWDAVNNRLV